MTKDSPQATTQPKTPRGPGWLGLSVAETMDWTIYAQLGAGPVQCRCAKYSPAWNARILDHDWIVSVAGQGLDSFVENPPPPGTKVDVRVHRNGHLLLFEVTLIERPRKKPDRRRAPLPAVACGRSITRHERPRWISEISVDKRLRPLDKAIGTAMAAHYANRQGEAYPSHKRLAQENGVSVASVKRAIARLHNLGLLQVKPPRPDRSTNTYIPCWSANALNSEAARKHFA